LQCIRLDALSWRPIALSLVAPAHAFLEVTFRRLVFDADRLMHSDSGTPIT
jgi:hypothetical protein